MRVSFEFFPPKTDKGLTSLLQRAQVLKKTAPEFFSVTYGAGGSTREGTRQVVAQLSSNTGVNSAPHLSMGDDSEETLHSLLDTYKANNVTRIVALKGDVPSGMGVRNSRGRNAETLVRLIRQHSGDFFHLEVAAYPEVHPDAKSPEADLAFFQRKVEAGANSAITQYFYNSHAYFDFANRCQQRGITIPIFPGIMPITNFEGLLRFSKACGADLPRWITKQLEAYQDDKPSLAKFGLEVVTKLCDELMNGGAPGLHFYTLNQAEPALAIWQNLNS